MTNNKMITIYLLKQYLKGNMEKSIKITKKELKEIIRESIREQIELAGSAEAEKDIVDWFEIANPHGATKDVFMKFFDKLNKKYSRPSAMEAFQNLYKNKKWLIYTKTPRGKEIFVLKKK